MSQVLGDSQPPEFGLVADAEAPCLTSDKYILADLGLYPPRWSQGPQGQEFSMLTTLLAEAPNVFGNLGIGVGAAGIMIGAGVGIAGAARGIGNIGGSAVEAIARQPEAKGSIGTNMIIAAALIEGFTFFALVIGLILMNKLV